MSMRSTRTQTAPPTSTPAAQAARSRQPDFRHWRERLAAALGVVPARIRYTRKSTAGDERQVASHSQQGAAADKEWGPLDSPWWWQDSTSGTTFNRPAFNDLLDFCRANPRRKSAPGRIEIYDPSRFGRTLNDDGEPDIMRWQRTYMELEDLHWQVHFVTVKRTGNVLADTMTMAVHAYAAATFSSNLSKSVRRGRVAHAANGWWVAGRAPWGTKRMDTRTGRTLEYGEPSTPGGGGTVLIPDPDVLKHWHWAARRILGGASQDAVGDALYKQGLRGPRNGRLGHRSVRNWLTNMALIGMTWYRDEAGADGGREVRLVKAKWNAMVDEDLFREVSRKLDGHTRAEHPRRRRQRELYPLTPVCAHCGIEYNGNRLAEAQGGTRGYTHAGPKERMNEEAFARMTSAGCRAWHVDAEELENKIKDVVVAARMGDDFVAEVRELLAERDVFRTTADEAVAAAERRLAEAKGVLETATGIMLLVRGEHSRAQAAEKITTAGQRVEAAEAELEKTRRFARSKADAWTRLEGIINETRNLSAAWDRSGPHERRILFDYWVYDVVIVVEPIPKMKKANYKTAIVTLQSAPGMPLHFDISGVMAQRVSGGAASSAARAARTSSRTAGSSSAAKRSRRATPAGEPPTRPSAHAACDRTSGSSSASAATSAGTSSGNPTLPSTTAALRLSPRSLARFIGDPRNAAVNSSGDMPNSSRARSRAPLPAMAGLGANGDPSDNARENLWVYGHTSWHTSHPYTRSPTPARSPSGMSPRASIVR